MKIGYIYKLVLFFSVAAFCSCSENEEFLPQTGELVPVKIQLPGVYDAPAGNNKTRATNHSELDGVPILQLKEKSTLWLFAKKGNNTPTIQGYMVKSANGGVQSLYPCGTKTNPDGTKDIDTTQISTTPLYLESGTRYTFSAISPALTIYSGNKFKIVNGQYAVATNNAWTQTQATTLTFTGKEGVVVLNPLMQIGARMTFTIKKTDQISSVSVIQSGVEVDGLGEDPGSANYSVGDNLTSEVGDSYNRLFVPSSTFKEDVSGNTLKSEIGINPVDCRSTAVYVILNLMVNGTPVQYTFAVKDRFFKPGYSYDYTIEIDIKDGITIANWQENSWSYNATPD